MLTDRLPASLKKSRMRTRGRPLPLDFRAKGGRGNSQRLARTRRAPRDICNERRVRCDFCSGPGFVAGSARRNSEASATESCETVNRLPAERTLRFKAELAEGAVIFASPIPGAHYRQWYLMLLLDRLIHRIVPFR